MSEAVKEAVKGRATGGRRLTSPWLVLAVVLVASMAGPINYYKAPPLMPFLMSSFHLGGGKAGFLMSIFAVVGIALSIPAGFILQKLGFRAAGLLGVAWIAAGAALGSMATSANSLLGTRLMEGIGLNLMAIVSPTIIAAYFTGKRRAAAVGIWNAWYPLGSFITFMVAPYLGALSGWQSVWWFGSIYAVAAGLLYYASVKPASVRPASPGPAAGAPSDATSDRSPAGNRESFRNRDVWKLGMMFFAFAFIYISYLTWTPTFLHIVRRLPLSQASFLMGLFSILALMASPVSGWILGKVRSARPLCVLIMAVFTALAISIRYIGLPLAVPLVVAMGAIASFLPGAIVTIVAQLMHEGKVSPIAVSLVTMCQNAGILLGPTLFGRVMETSGGWTVAYATFIPVGLLGACAAFLLTATGGREGIAGESR